MLGDVRAHQRPGRRCSTNWVTAGGNLIALRPDKKLAGLLGLTDLGDDARRRLPARSPPRPARPGAGIVGETIQFHGTADRYLLNGADRGRDSVLERHDRHHEPGGDAAHRSAPTAARPRPSPTTSRRSVVYTRQGNPAWAGQERDGVTPIRPDDLFFGAKTGDVQPDWVDLNKVAIPQADEQQRLLANLITLMGEDRKPVPRFWYLPRGRQGRRRDDRRRSRAAAARPAASTSTSRPARPAARSRSGSACGRPRTSIPAPRSRTHKRQAYTARASRSRSTRRRSASTQLGCANWTAAATAERASTTQLAVLRAKYTSVPRADHPPDALRRRGADWASQPEGRARERDPAGHQLLLLPRQLDGREARLHDRLGHADALRRHRRQPHRRLPGATRRSPTSPDRASPSTINALLDGADRRRTATTARSSPTSTPTAPRSPESDAIVAAAQARGVPIVSAKQLLDWTDGREQSTMTAFTWSGATLGLQGPRRQPRRRPDGDASDPRGDADAPDDHAQHERRRAVHHAHDQGHRRTRSSTPRRAATRRPTSSGEVGDPGLEPGTSSLSEKRSNRLS